MNPPQCKICSTYWLNEGRPMGNYLIVSRGGHIPGAHDSAAAPAPTNDESNAELHKKIDQLKAEVNDLSRKLSIKESGKEAHDSAAAPAPAPAPTAPDKCKECNEYWVKEGRPREHYLIISEGRHIPGVHGPCSTSEKTRADAAGTSEVPKSNANSKSTNSRRK